MQWTKKEKLNERSDHCSHMAYHMNVNVGNFDHSTVMLFGVGIIETIFVVKESKRTNLADIKTDN